MLGKQKCKILKEIRQRIADENDIPYVTRECTHKGECRGTCPSCESELRYLERELAARQSLGKRVAVAALCAGLAFGSAGCDLAPSASPLSGDVTLTPAPTRRPRTTPRPSPTQTPEPDVLMGEVPDDGPLMGRIAPTEPPELEGEPVVDGEIELMGDVAYFTPEPTGEDLPVETGAEDGANG